MKVISWNIRHGGGPKGKLIVSALREHDPDVIILIEYRAGRSAEICRELAEMGWIHIESSDPAGSANGICVLSRIPLVRCVPQSAPIEIMSRWLDVDFVNQSFRLTAVHIPGEEKHRKRFFWNAVLTAAQHNVSRPFILMGDFNTGLHEIDETGKTFWFPELFKQLSTMGWVDGWRHFHGNSSLEPSWVSRLKGGAPGNPFRIDHAFLSPALLPRVRDCWYSHREREENISDHSMLLIQLDFDE